MQILVLLVRRRGEVITKEEVRGYLWPGNSILDADDALSTAIRKIRVALCDQAGKPRYVETLPKTGYRFIAGVLETEPAAVATVAPPPVAVTAPAAGTDRRRLRWGLAATLHWLRESWLV